mmetsp:Transcript_47739/g.139185  ORF Transcript_47739/g.139185 Transcript_47739/m.139185 type:complete len:219 (-) Transcript_47739:8-664(-)
MPGSSLLGLEGGVKPQHFWKWAVEKEALTRARRNRRFEALEANALRRSESAPDGRLPIPSALMPGQSPEEPLRDHGLVFCSLHGLHQRAAQASAQPEPLRLPPVAQPLAPLPQGSAWFGGACSRMPSDVESAVTITSAALAASALTVGSMGDASSAAAVMAVRAGGGSATDACAPRSVLSASSPVLGRDGHRALQRKGTPAFAFADQRRHAADLQRSG